MLAQRSALESLALAPGLQTIFERVQPRLGGPEVVADHGHGVVEPDDLAHARDLRVRLSRRRSATVPPSTGQPATVAIFMPGEDHVDAEDVALPLTLSGVSSRLAAFRSA